MRSRSVLIVFVRAPRLGAVKRRLATGIGDVPALQFYRQTMQSILGRISDTRRWRTVLAVTPDSAVSCVRPWPRGIDRIAQGTGDLGRRMENAMLRHPRRPVVIVGSDIPDLRSHHIERAFAALGSNDLVFGPADDGGYWLVGVRAGTLARGLFGNVRWSGPHALADTISNVQNRRVALVDQLADIDDANDLLRWRTDKAGGAILRRKIRA